MITLLSPAKSLDFSPANCDAYTTPEMLDASEKLVGVLRKKTAKKLMTLMSVSENIARLNVERFQKFALPFTPENAKQAVLAFDGDVYAGLSARSFDADDLAFAQKHLRILSGLYGLLRPLDLIQPYRLEMGTRLPVGRRKNLYEFWGDRITDALNAHLADSGSDCVVNLASQEYFRAVRPKKLAGRVYHIAFKENRNGVYKIISFNAKKARGAMARQIVQNRIDSVEALKDLEVDGYVYDPALSDGQAWVFAK